MKSIALIIICVLFTFCSRESEKNIVVNTPHLKIGLERKSAFLENQSINFYPRNKDTLLVAKNISVQEIVKVLEMLNSNDRLIKYDSVQNTKIHLYVTLKDSACSDFQKLIEISSFLKREKLLNFELLEKKSLDKLVDKGLIN